MVCLHAVRTFVSGPARTHPVNAMSARPGGRYASHGAAAAHVTGVLLWKCMVCLFDKTALAGVHMTPPEWILGCVGTS